MKAIAGRSPLGVTLSVVLAFGFLFLLCGGGVWFLLVAVLR